MNKTYQITESYIFWKIPVKMLLGFLQTVFWSEFSYWYRDRLKSSLFLMISLNIIPSI